MNAVATATEQIALNNGRDVPAPSTESTHEDEAAVSALQRLLALPTDTIKKIVGWDIPDMGWA